MGQDEKPVFLSPQEAVERIAKLLREEDWPALAGYYDLDGTEVDPKQLHSGDFFIRTERPETAHPGGFWRYKQPFSPAFKYESHGDSTKHPGDVIVTVGVSIDQGGGMVQRGMSFFRLRRSGGGFRLAPNTGDEAQELQRL
ncbi:hypothetical protein ACFL2T_07645 [Elusimicrobiota bacterium]